MTTPVLSSSPAPVMLSSTVYFTDRLQTLVREVLDEPQFARIDIIYSTLKSI